MLRLRAEDVSSVPADDAPPVVTGREADLVLNVDGGHWSVRALQDRVQLQLGNVLLQTLALFLILFAFIIFPSGIAAGLISL